MEKAAKIYVAGHRGLVGQAIMKKLHKDGHSNIIIRTHVELDLTNQAAVFTFFEKEKPEYIFLAAAKVGGIGANSQFPADFIYQNMMIGFNVVHAAYRFGVKKLMNLGSSCIYPKLAPQPLKEEYLLTGSLEPSNEAYALAKIAVIKLCTSYNKQYGTDFLSAMPTNLYGPGDNYDLNASHVLPAMIRKFHEAKISTKDEVTLWGDGSPYREFLYSEDLAQAVIFLMNEKSAIDLRTGLNEDFINVGSGIDLPIKELAHIIYSIVYEDVRPRTCTIYWDTSKPNGTPKKLMDSSQLNQLGFTPSVSLKEGIRYAYEDFLSKKASC